MAEEAEYFWDDETEMYYYYDAEADAYVPYIEEGVEGQEGDGKVEEENDGAVQDEGGPAEEEGEGEEPGEVTASTLDSGTSTDLDSMLSTGEANTFTMPSRLMSRKLSFAEHGGLAGCLSIAAREREARGRAGVQIMTSVGVSNEESLIRDAQEQAKESHSRHFGVPEVEHSEPPSVIAAALPAAAMFDPRQRARKTTLMRFGTKDFGGSNADNALAAMLSRQVLGASGGDGTSELDKNDQQQ